MCVVACRHLDNLLLCQDGRLFHIDFGFILGRDPKPFPPPMKLCREMVDVMGGGAAPGSSEPSTAAGKWDRSVGTDRARAQERHSWGPRAQR